MIIVYLCKRVYRLGLVNSALDAGLFPITNSIDNCWEKSFKVVPEGFGVKVNTVKHIGGGRFLTARSSLNLRTLRLLYMPAQIL